MIKVKATNKIFAALSLTFVFQALAIAQEKPAIQNEVFYKQESIAIAPVLGATSFNIAGSGMSSRGGGLFGIETILPTGVAGLSFITGFDYVETGAKNENFFASAEYAIGSIMVPAIAQWNFSENKETGRRFYLRGGLALTQVTSAKAKVMFFGEQAEQDIKSSIANNDLLVTAGIGGSIKVFEELRATLDLSWAQGTVNTIKDQEGKSSGLVATTSLVIPL